MKPGDKVYVLLHGHEPVERQVLAIEGEWGTLSDGWRFRVSDGHLAGWRGAVYEDAGVAREWLALLRALPFSPPPGVTADAVLAARNMLGIRRK